MLLFMTLACSSSSADSDTDAPGDTDVAPTVAPDYEADGAAQVTVERSSFSTGGCDMEYTTFTPDTTASSTLIVLSHGFARSRDNMDGHARHLASWGLLVATPNLCHASFTDTDHAQNARDVQALADHLGATKVIYAGHSAGGLASWLAAGNDTRTVAMIGLDPVDSNDEGLGASSKVTAHAYGLFGESSQCNAQNNGLAWYTNDRRSLRVSESDHCDYESPTDGVCTAFCGASNPDFSDVDIQTTVATMLTAAAAYEAGADPLGLQYWTPGEGWYDGLAATGILAKP